MADLIGFRLVGFNGRAGSADLSAEQDVPAVLRSCIGFDSCLLCCGRKEKGNMISDLKEQ